MRPSGFLRLCLAWCLLGGMAVLCEAQVTLGPEDPVLKDAGTSGLAATGQAALTEEEELLGSRTLPMRSNRVFSLQDITLLALKNNLQVKIARITPHISEAQIQAAEAVFDATLALSAVTGETNTPSFDIFDNLTSAETEVTRGRAEVTKDFTTGGTGTISLDLARSETEGFSPSVESLLSLTFTQPLLRGAGRDVNLADVHIAQNNTMISRWDFKTRVINTVFAVQQTYWNLVFALEDLEVRKKSWRLSKNTLAQTQAQVDAGLLARIEITRVRADVASKEEGIISAQRVVEDQEDILRRIINQKDTSLTEDVGIVPLDRAAYVPVSVDLLREVTVALGNRPDYMQARLDVENRDIAIVVARSGELPQLDVGGSLDVNGLGHDLSDSLDTLGDVDFVDWSASATFSYPLGNRAARSVYLQAKLAKVQSLLRLKDLEDQVILDVKAAVRLMNTDLKRIKSTRLARELAEERLSDEIEKLNVGTAIILDVLEAQTLLAQAEQAEYRAIVDYNLDLIQLERVKGTLLEANAVYLPEEKRSVR